MGKVHLTVNGMKVEARKDASILEAAREAGVYIPTLCSRPDLPVPLGDCRLCVVEVEGAPERFPSSCVTAAAEGMVVNTQTALVQQLRRQFFKALLSPLPSPRLIRPELKKLAEYIGVAEEDFPPYVSRNLPVDRDQPLFELDHNRCILCGLCARVCQDVRGVHAIDFSNQDGKWKIGAFLPKENHCRFCGACVEVCPTGAITDKDGAWPGYETGVAPCTYACPAGTDVPRYVSLIHQRRFAEAAAVIREKLPFPGVLGRVCTRPCEQKCRRSDLNEPISIAALKRFAGDRDARLWRSKMKVSEPTGKRVAIIGSGPAGLSAGYYLAKRGHAVTIFESQSEPGGMMQSCIPPYRLPREILADDLSEIKRSGLEIRTHTAVKSLSSLFKKGYDAILLATGAHRPLKLSVENEDHPAVLEGITFLKAVNAGAPVTLGEKVGVIGGGSVAIDVARSAARLGAKAVHLICLESQEEMPATQWEIQEAVEEGVLLHCSCGVKRIGVAGSKIKKVDFVRCSSVFDPQGRFSPCFDEAQTSSLDLDTLIVAIGQAPDLTFLGKAGKVQRTARGLIKVDAATLQTDRKGVFAAGDAVSGPASVIDAIGMARKAASSIDRYLGGTGEIDETLIEAEEPRPWLGREQGFADLARIRMPCSGLEQRMPSARNHGFSEVELGFSEEKALEEAKRCLQCHLRFQIQRMPVPPKHSGKEGEYK